MKTRADRGSRPKLRGWIHFGGALIATIAGLILGIYASIHLNAAQAASVWVYAIGVVVLFGVSAAYHLMPWKTHTTIAWWRRADHSTIAVFIAATYTPLCVIALHPPISTVMFTMAWVGALCSVVLNLVWITHPRWLGTAVYLVLGWLIIPAVPKLWALAGHSVVVLLAAGGLVYTVGALMYALRWPGRVARWVGYHEFFHAATIIAAALHMVAVWIVVVRGPLL